MTHRLHLGRHCPTNGQGDERRADLPVAALPTWLRIEAARRRLERDPEHATVACAALAASAATAAARAAEQLTCSNPFRTGGATKGTR